MIANRGWGLHRVLLAAALCVAVLTAFGAVLRAADSPADPVVETPAAPSADRPSAPEQYDPSDTPDMTGRDAAFTARMSAQKQRIDAALANDHDGWDGVYHDGNGYDWRELSYAGSQGFAYRAGTCTGGYASLGETDMDTPTGTLHLLRLQQSRDFAGLAEPANLLTIAWGERRYLVPENQLGDFARDIHSGEEPRCGGWGRFLLRSGDERRIVSGLPELPAPWQGLLRREALVLRVTALTVEEDGGADDSRHLRYTLTFDGGADRGLLVGTKLRPLHLRQAFYGDAAVIAVGAHDAVARYEHWISHMEYANEFGLLPRSGGSHPIDAEVVGPALGVEFTTGALPADIDAPHCDPSTLTGVTGGG